MRGDYCYYESPLKWFGRVTMAAIRIPRRALSSPAAWPLCETDRESGLLPINGYLLDRCTCTYPMRHDSASRYRLHVRLICSRSIANCVSRSRYYYKNVVTIIENLYNIQYIDFSKFDYKLVDHLYVATLYYHASREILYIYYLL